MNSPEPKDDALNADESAALAVAGALFAEDTAPAGDAGAARERFVQAFSTPAPAAQPGKPLDVRLNCTYCHDGLVLSDSVHCGLCLAPHHADCVEVHGTCAAPGCMGSHFVRAQPTNARPTRRRWRGALIAAALVGGVAAAAYVPRGEASSAGEGVTSETSEGAVAEEPLPAEPGALTQRPAGADGRQRVLYVEGYPRWNYRYLKQVLLAEPQIALQCLLLSGSPGFVNEASEGLPALAKVPANLKDYDVVILGDVAPDAFGEAWLTALQREVKEHGLGVILASGAQHPHGLADTPLEPLIPVRFGSDARTGKFQLLLSKLGEHATPLRFGATWASNRALWTSLPRIQWHAGALAAKPGAEVWVDASGTSSEGPAPVLAWSTVGHGRVVWLGFEEAWRWRAEVGDEYLARCFLSLLTHVQPTRTPPGDSDRTPSDVQATTVREAEALLIAAVRAFDEGRGEQALEELQAIHTRYGEFLDNGLGESVDAERALGSQVLSSMHVAQELEGSDAVAPLEKVLALLERRPGNVYRLEARRQLDVVRAALEKAEEDRHKQAEARCDEDLKTGLRALRWAFRDGSTGRMDAEGARELFERVRKNPAHTPAQIQRIQVAVASGEAGARYLYLAKRDLERNRETKFVDMLPRLRLLADWLPSGQTRTQARELLQQISGQFAGRRPDSEEYPKDATYDGQRLAEIGIEKANKGQFVDAIADFDAALMEDPRYLRALSWRGYCNEQLGRYSKATEDFSAVIRLQSRFLSGDRGTFAYLDRASVLVKLGRFAEAVEDYDRALQQGLSEPTYSEVSKLRANAAAKPGQRNELPKSTCVAALRLADLGITKAEAGHYVEAIVDFDAALEEDPDYATALYWRGKCKANLQRYSEAIADYDAVIEIEPRLPLVLVERANAQVKLGRFAEAIEDYDRALQLGVPEDRHAEVTKLRAEAAANSGQREKRKRARPSNRE